MFDVKTKLNALTLSGTSVSTEMGRPQSRSQQYSYTSDYSHSTDSSSYSHSTDYSWHI